jgi:hypothetical protein
MAMKPLLKITSILLMTIAISISFVSCQKVVNDKNWIGFSERVISFDSAGGEKTVPALKSGFFLEQLTSYGPDNEVLYQDFHGEDGTLSCEWCTIINNCSTGSNSMTISVSKNKTGSMRTCKVYAMMGGYGEVVTINQEME